MRKWIVAITTISAALLMSCGDESSNSSPTYPGDTEKEIDDNTLTLITCVRDTNRQLIIICKLI